jgi:phage/plasmid primase-like uncharacterized protein
MTLASITAALGGDLYDGGRRASVPAPGHSARDRSVSLLLTPSGRVVIHGFGSGDWRVMLAELRARGLVDDQGRLVACGPPAPPARAALSPRARTETARRLWEAAGPVRAGSSADLYARRRGVARPLWERAELRAHPAAPVSVYRPRNLRRPALLAAIRDAAGGLCAVEVTYLTPGGRRDERLRTPRKTIGVLSVGAAVRLDPAAPVLLVAEGVFSALSGGELCGLPAWALLSTGNLRLWSPPPEVRRVVVAADADRPGLTAAAELMARLRGIGVSCELRLPPAPRLDWNDAAAARANSHAPEGA